MSVSKARPCLRFPGSKWNLAAWIVSHFPKHSVYCEPFFGSGAAFFTKRPSKLETINDLDGDVANLFRVIRQRPEEIAAAAAMTPYARSEHAEAWKTRYTGDPVEDARRFLVRCWMNHGMRVRRKGGWAHATGMKRLPGSGGLAQRSPQWRRLPETILATAERLRDAQIESRPALDVIARYAHSDCLIYADPPYVLSTRSEAQYAHEMTDGDHSELLAALDDHPGPVVLSGYECELYESLAVSGWAKKTARAFAEGGRERKEVLWINSVCDEALHRRLF